MGRNIIFWLVMLTIFWRGSNLLANELSKDSLQMAEQFYVQGLRDYSALRFREAQLAWQLALNHINDDSCFLYKKVKGALALFPHVLPNISSVHPEPFDFAQNRPVEGDALEKEDKDTTDKINAKFETAREFLDEAKQKESKDNFLEACDRYHKAISLFGPNDLKPPFYRQIELDTASFKEKWMTKLGPQLDQWEIKLKTDRDSFIKIGLELRTIAMKCPILSRPKELLQKIYARLQAAAQMSLMKAKTIQALEGCKPALDFYQQTLDIALFPEVTAWQQAYKNLETCKMSQSK